MNSFAFWLCGVCHTSPPLFAPGSRQKVPFHHLCEVLFIMAARRSRVRGASSVGARYIWVYFGSDYYYFQIQRFLFIVFLKSPHCCSWEYGKSIFFKKDHFSLPLYFSKTYREEKEGLVTRPYLVHCWFCAHLTNCIMLELEVCYDQQAKSVVSPCGRLFVADLWQSFCTFCLEILDLTF